MAFHVREYDTDGIKNVTILERIWDNGLSVLHSYRAYIHGENVHCQTKHTQQAVVKQKIDFNQNMYIELQLIKTVLSKLMTISFHR